AVGGGERRLRVVGPALGFVELGLDAGGAAVQPVEDHPVGADLHQHADEDHECDREPEMGVGEDVQHGGPSGQRLSTASTAALTVDPGALTPVSRDTIAAAASV